MPRPAEWVAPGQRGPKVRDIDDTVGKLFILPGGVIIAVYDIVQSGAYGVVVHGNDRFPVGGNNLFVVTGDIETVPELPAFRDEGRLGP